METSRYIVGIDLGTTNCAVSYIDTEEHASGSPEARTFRIPQVTGAGIVEERDFLPSFLYLPSDTELPERSLSLPWNEDMQYVVGEFAHRRGAEVPLRLVSSAKSWLCYPAVDRTAPLLPWNAPEGVPKVSPLEASARELEHIRMAWNHGMAGGNPALFLENQQVLVTVPASFDAVARDLTGRAAERAGLKRITLMEEPQAAFYAWLNRSGEEWRRQVTVGDTILVCDIGGGTTDFSLIEVSGERGELELKRVAVGEHILLGGDNMDLALAFSVRTHFVEKKITLDTRQTLGLVHQCRTAKEAMLNNPDLSVQPVVILGKGKSVVGGALRTDLHREEMERVIVEGFFPKCSAGDFPRERRATGLKEIGLQYAADTAVTRHLAKFLRQNVRTTDGADKESTFVHPTRILFNGGVTKSSVLRGRIIEVLNGWLASEGGESLSVLTGSDPDRAVAAGAAYYGFAKRGKGIRIRAGASRTYYIGVESSMPAVPGMPPPLKALCVVPFGMEEGTDFAIPDQVFGLVVGEHATFRFLSSLSRKEDAPGSVIEEWAEGEIEELSPLEAVLPAEGVEQGAVVPVRLHSYLTETGALEVWCEALDGSNRWKLEFTVREEARG
ncbi:MAG: Hsp70 family protein [Alphaproteobacteria bacterium]|uniref:Hsp70 family protein n=1 Tax=Candidatus Nitrobium versatile TaxID=2884831 RepID=A0A953JDD6_9BACT|nr:Hsp70 family protein [Candidatus Nitrobium versatile]